MPPGDKETGDLGRKDALDKELATRARSSEKLLHPCTDKTGSAGPQAGHPTCPPPPPTLSCSESQGMGANSCSLHLPRPWVTGFIEGVGLLEEGDRRMFPPTSLSQAGLRQWLNLFLGSTSH